jgi:hypothetical protein
MNGGVVNLDGKHWWYQWMWPMSKYRGGEFGNAENITTLIVDDCLWAEHVNWWQTKLAFVMKRQPHVGHKTWGCEGGGPIVDINGWKIIRGWYSKLGIKCVHIPCEGEKTGWNIISRMGMIGWQSKVVSQLSIGIISTQAFGYDAYYCFGVDENVRFAIPTDIKTILLSQNRKSSSHLAPIKNLRPLA